MTNTSVSAALGLIGYAKRIDDPVSATTAAELATARLDRRRPRIRAQLMAVHDRVACLFSPVPAPTSGPRRRGVQ